MSHLAAACGFALLARRTVRNRKRLPSQSENLNKNCRRPLGFTLIEVLTAMMLMAIILPVAMRGISLSLRAAEVAKRTALAATLADSKLNELASSTQTVTAGTATGDFSPDYPTYQWQATTTSISLGLDQIDVQVTWKGRDGQRNVQVSTVVYPQSQS